MILPGEVLCNKCAAVSQNNLEALDQHHHSEIIAFYTDFSKTFDKVLHCELNQTLTDMGVVGCMLGIDSNYLKDRQKYVRVHSTSSKILEKTSGVSHGSLLSP